MNTAQSTADLLPESEGLGSMMSPKLPTKSAISAAEQTAKRIAAGDQFECNRIGKKIIRTSPDECVGFYHNAVRRGDRVPCFECAKLQLFLKERGEVMSRPAQKGTPDPIAQEAQAVTAKKQAAQDVESREITTKPVVAQKEPETILKAADPLAGLTKYNPADRYRKRAESFVRMHKNGFDVTAQAVQDFGFSKHNTIDAYYDQQEQGQLGRIVLVLAGDNGSLRLTRSAGRGESVKASAAGLISRMGIELPGSIRMDIKELAPGVLELIPREVAA